jgi:hypothetical protein
VTDEAPEVVLARRLSEVRTQLAALSRRSNARRTAGDRTRPCKWWPNTVKTRVPDMYFTEVGAWQFVAECLESGTPIEEVVLRKPEGRKAYVMKVHVLPEHETLYIKLQLGAGAVIGRSFHYSEFDTDD